MSRTALASVVALEEDGRLVEAARAALAGTGVELVKGPLAKGDATGPAQILRVLEGMLDFYGDPRYRPLFEWPFYETFLIVSTLAFVVAGAVRLARFNVTSAEVGPDRFEGLTSTFAGFIVATFLLSGEQHRWPLEVMAALPLLLLLCAAFMISNLSLPKSLSPDRRWLFPLLVIAHVLAYGLGILRLFPAVLLVLALAYPILGFSLSARLSRAVNATVSRDNFRPP